MNIFNFQSAKETAQGILSRLRGLDKRIAFRNSLRNVAETADGKVVLEQLLRDCNVTSPVFHTDPIQAAFHEGRRQLAMSYLVILEQDGLDDLRARLAAERDHKPQTTE